jgi:hypothetical protein
MKKIDKDIGLMKQAIHNWSMAKFTAYENPDCPLCDVYVNEKNQYGGACMSCPIKVITRKESCRGTPYYEGQHCGTQAEWKRFCTKMVKFLKEMLLTLEAKRDAVKI